MLDTNMSNKSHVKELFGDNIVTADDSRGQKPLPDPYLKIIEKWGIDPSQILAVEDSPEGIKSATDAKLDTLWIRDPFWKNDFEHLQKASSYQVDCFSQIQETF